MLRRRSSLKMKARMDAVHQDMSRSAVWLGALTTWAGSMVRVTDCTQRAQRKGRWDEVKLWQMGYKQELPRTFTFWNNVGCSFSVLSVFAVVDSYSTQGLAYGGPVVVIWGWITVSFFSLCVACCLAELVSAFPTSGGLYYWAWILAPPRWRAFSCWMTGWTNLLGQITFTASLEIALTHFLSTLVTLATTGTDGSPGVQLTRNHQLIIFAGLLAIHAWMNCITQRWTAVCISFSALWGVIALSAFFIVIALVAPTHQSNSFVWTSWEPHTDMHGISNPVYIVLVGLLFSQWIIMGYDACIHLSEETIDADKEASWAVVVSVAGCSVFGLGMLLSLTYSVQSVPNLFDPNSVTGGKAVAQLAWDVFEARYGSGRGAVPLLFIPAVGLFFCAFTSMAANGRMVYAFSRDGAMLGSRVWKQLGNKSHLPVAGTWLMALLSFIMGLPGMLHIKVFNTMSSVSVVALSLSYGAPIAWRFWHGSSGFIPGPFRLGRWSRPLGALSCGWIGLVSVVFLLPSVYPVTTENFNYAPVMLVAVLAFALAMWWAPWFGGCHWFTGPTVNVNVGNTDDGISATIPGALHAEANQQPSLPAIHEADPRSPSLAMMNRLSSMAPPRISSRNISRTTRRGSSNSRMNSSCGDGPDSIPSGQRRRGTASGKQGSSGQLVDMQMWNAIGILTDTQMVTEEEAAAHHRSLEDVWQPRPTAPTCNNRRSLLLCEPTVMRSASVLFDASASRPFLLLPPSAPRAPAAARGRRPVGASKSFWMPKTTSTVAQQSEARSQPSEAWQAKAVSWQAAQASSRNGRRGSHGEDVALEACIQRAASLVPEGGLVQRSPPSSPSGWPSPSPSPRTGIPVGEVSPSSPLTGKARHRLSVDDSQSLMQQLHSANASSEQWEQGHLSRDSALWVKSRMAGDSSTGADHSSIAPSAQQRHMASSQASSGHGQHAAQLSLVLSPATDHDMRLSPAPQRQHIRPVLLACIAGAAQQLPSHPTSRQYTSPMQSSSSCQTATAGPSAPGTPLCAAQAREGGARRASSPVQHGPSSAHGRASGHRLTSARGSSSLHGPPISPDRGAEASSAECMNGPGLPPMTSKPSLDHLTRPQDCLVEDVGGLQARPNPQLASTAAAVQGSAFWSSNASTNPYGECSTRSSALRSSVIGSFIAGLLHGDRRSGGSNNRSDGTGTASASGSGVFSASAGSATSGRSGRRPAAAAAAGAAGAAAGAAAAAAPQASLAGVLRAAMVTASTPARTRQGTVSARLNSQFRTAANVASRRHDGSPPGHSGQLGQLQQHAPVSQPGESHLQKLVLMLDDQSHHPAPGRPQLPGGGRRRAPTADYVCIGGGAREGHE